MAHLQTIHLAHLPPDLAIHIALYTNLQNASFLHEQLLKGNSDFEYAFIDASAILSPTHLFAAIFRACNDSLHNRLKSRNVHSEIVFSLGYTNNIASTLRSFGTSASTRDLIAVKVAMPGSDLNQGRVAEHLGKQVEGTMMEFGEREVAEMTDLGLVRKLYKLNPGGGGGGGKESKMERRRRLAGAEVGIGAPENGRREAERDEEAERTELEVAVLGLMALRGAM